ncbi:MAG: hypothetical protein ACW964_16185 [Candidatus Hodarchaeales archaeon]
MNEKKTSSYIFRGMDLLQVDLMIISKSTNTITDESEIEAIRLKIEQYNAKNL